MPSVSFLTIYFPRSPGRAAFPANTHQSASTKVRMLAINRNPLQTVIGPEPAHPRLPWHSRCLLAGIGRGTECCAWLDAPRFAAKPQVQGRLASEEGFGPSCEYAPTALTIKPDLFARTMTVRASAARVPKFQSVQRRA